MALSLVLTGRVEGKSRRLTVGNDLLDPLPGSHGSYLSVSHQKMGYKAAEPQPPTSPKKTIKTAIYLPTSQPNPHPT